MRQKRVSYRPGIWEGRTQASHMNHSLPVDDMAQARTVGSGNQLLFGGVQPEKKITFFHILSDKQSYCAHRFEF